jgi:hypothetical protein
MKPAPPNFTDLLIVKIAKLFKSDLALQNDFLRRKLGKRISQDHRRYKTARP